MLNVDLEDKNATMRKFCVQLGKERGAGRISFREKLSTIRENCYRLFDIG